MGRRSGFKWPTDKRLQKMLSNEAVSPRSQVNVRSDEEHQHQAAFFKTLAYNEKRVPDLRFVFAIPNAAKRNKAERGRLLAEGMRSGVPDIFIPIPRHGYCGAWIENKSANGKLTPQQKDFLEFLARVGYATKICYSVDEQVKFLEFYLGIELSK